MGAVCKRFLERTPPLGTPLFNAQQFIGVNLRHGRPSGVGLVHIDLGKLPPNGDRICPGTAVMTGVVSCLVGCFIVAVVVTVDVIVIPAAGGRDGELIIV